jgi:hypothetical protein
MKGLDDLASDAKISKPERAGCGGIEGAIHEDKLPPGGRRTGRSACATGQGAMESPGDEERAVFWMPVREVAFVIGHGRIGLGGTGTLACAVLKILFVSK